MYNDNRDTTSNPMDDYNAYGMDNFHQDLDLDPSGPGETEDRYDGSHTSGYFVQAATQFTCGTCYSMFRSRNKLFKHLCEMKHQTMSMVTTKTVATVFAHSTEPPNVIKSDAPPVVGSGMAFRNSNFLEVAIRPTPSGEDHFVYLDTGCGMSCVDRNFLRKEFPTAVVQNIPPIEICGLGNKIHQSTEYAVITIYLSGYNKTDTHLAEITREVHLVDSLPCDMLIGNDIAEPEGFLIDIPKRRVTVQSCQNLSCPIRITPRGKPVEHRMVRTKRDIILRKNSKTIIPVVSKRLSDSCDYRFLPRYDPSIAHLAVHGTFPESVLDTNSMFVAYYNTSTNNILLPANTRIGEISEWQSDEHATPEDPNVIDCLFTTAKIIPSLKLAMTIGLTALQAAQALMMPGQGFRPTDSFLSNTVVQDPYSSMATNAYTLFPPLDESGNTPSKFGPDAVNVNTNDDIMKEQIDALRNVIAEFPSL
jgi:hypothetical protein